MFKKDTIYELDTARWWDWLTALSPLLLMMVYNYGLPAVWVVLGATGGYFVASSLWRLVRIPGFHLAPALVCGALVACCLPAVAPVWVALVAGAVGGCVVGIPYLVNRFVRRTPLSCPVYVPALTGYLAVRWLFATHLVGATLPAMWTPPDAVAGATPLAAMAAGDVTAERLHWMFWGFDVGSMGSGPVLAILLGGAFVLLRRRANPLSPLAMLAVVAVAFQLRFALPAYGLLAGGAVLAALLLGDGAFVRTDWKGQLVAGVIAGGVTVFCRLRHGVDGAAVGVLIACVSITGLYFVGCGLRPLTGSLMQKFAKSKN